MKDLKQFIKETIREYLNENINDDLSIFLSDKKFTNARSKQFLYHGTNISPENFNLRDDYDFEDSNTWSGDLPEGYLFLTTSLKEAKAYGKYVIPCELKNYDSKRFNVNASNPSQIFDRDYGIDLYKNDKYYGFWEKYEESGKSVLVIKGTDRSTIITYVENVIPRIDLATQFYNQFIKETIRGNLNESKYFSNEVKTLKKELTDQFTDYAKLDEKINDYEYTTVSKIKKENINISLNLALTDDRDVTYPIDNARIGLYVSDGTLYGNIYITINEEYKNNTFDDLKRNVEFNGVLIHELHHIISNKHLYFPNKRIDTNKRHVFLKLAKEESEEEFRRLLYYLSKDELNSIIPQVNMGSYQYVKDLFNKYNNMPYSEFEKIFNENSNTKLNNKTYNKIMDRIKYFINKTKK